jgi:hypothetical protein
LLALLGSLPSRYSLFASRCAPFFVPRFSLFVCSLREHVLSAACSGASVCFAPGRPRSTTGHTVRYVATVSNRTAIIRFVLLVGIVVSTAVAASAGILYVREAEHNDFHKSLAAQHALLADLRWVYPPGTPKSVVLRDFGVEADAVQPTEAGEVLAIKPPLRGADTEREYRGVAFLFVDGAVAMIDRIGPDGPGMTVDDTGFRKRLSGYRGGS